MTVESTLTLWLHPFRSWRELSGLRKECDSLRTRAERLEKRLDDEESALAESRRVQNQLQQLRTNLEEDIDELRRVNTEQAKRLTEWEAASAEMERVASQLEKMVNLREQMNRMRTEYEERIARLERQLWSSRQGGLQYARREDGIPDPSESELLEPGESPFAPPLPIRMAPDRPKITPATDDTDLLLSLGDL